MCFPAEANPIKENSACGLCCVLASELFLLDILWSEISNPANNTKPTRLSISDTKITSQSCSQGKSWSVSAVLLWGRSVEGNGKNRDAGCRHVGARASAERGKPEHSCDGRTWEGGRWGWVAGGTFQQTHWNVTLSWNMALRLYVSFFSPTERYKPTAGRR